MESQTGMIDLLIGAVIVASAFEPDRWTLILLSVGGIILGIILMPWNWNDRKQ
jgi:hypothetical protein